MYSDPSEEIERIEDKVKECDPMIGFMHPNLKGDESDINRNKTTVKMLCKHFSKGFCKNGSSCDYSHESLDCNEHINNGKSYRNNCTQRHRQCCKFYNKLQEGFLRCQSEKLYAMQILNIKMTCGR